MPSPSPRRPHDSILDLLARHGQRVTYGAFAGVVGGIARGVMQGQPKTPRNSFVVSQRDGRPTGYLEHQMAAALFARPRVLRSGHELRAWLANPQ